MAIFVIHRASYIEMTTTKRKLKAAPEKPAESLDAIARVSAGVTLARADQLDDVDVHYLGHPDDEDVRSLAHIYTPWGDVRANGSGIVALAAWAKRLEEEGLSSAEGQDLTSYIRGLIHR